MNRHFLSHTRPYIWFPASQCPPSLDMGEEMSYQMILSIDLVGVIAGFYDHNKKQFCKVCERYLGYDGTQTDPVAYLETINNNLVWTYEPVDQVISWMLIPVPAIVNQEQDPLAFWLN